MKFDRFKDNIDDACSDFIKVRNGKMWRFRAFLRLFLKFTDDMRKDYVGQFAAQSAFFTILSAVPFLMLVILCLKYFISVDVSAVTAPINSAFPSQVSVYVVQIITEVFYRSESIAGLSITAITALWASSRGTMAVYCGLNEIYGYVRTYRWISARITTFFYNIIFELVIVASAIILIFGNTLLAFMEEEFLPAHYLLLFVIRSKTPIFLVLLILAFTAVYTFLPQKKMKFRSQLPGAVFTAVGWLIFSYLFSLYIEYFSKYSVLYGSLTAIILLMLWVFSCVYMLLIGAEINKHKENGFFKRARRNLAKKTQKSS